MKKLIFTLLFTILVFSSPTYAGWMEIIKGDGITFYVDFDTIKKHDGYVYYWELGDYLKPNEFGDLSAKVYREVDCKLFRFKVLGDSYYTEPMGRGTPSASSNIADKEWSDLTTLNSAAYSVLKKVCSK
jgi:hypothetical protein